MSEDGTSQAFLLRVGGLVAISSLVLTASFVGIFAFVNGTVAGVGDRFPVYLVVAGLAFVATIVVLEGYREDGRLIMMTTIVVATITFAVVVLAAEGAIYTLSDPDTVFSSRLLFYLLAAGLIATGIGFWSIRHWREFTGATGHSL